MEEVKRLLIHFLTS